MATPVITTTTTTEAPKRKCQESEAFCINCKGIRPMSKAESYEKQFRYKDRDAIPALNGKKAKPARPGKDAVRHFTKGECGNCGKRVSRLVRAKTTQ